MRIPEFAPNVWRLTGDDAYRLDGNVGVGLSAPEAKLHVDGNAIADVPTLGEHLVTKSYVDGAIPVEVTEENFTIQVALDGTDPIEFVRVVNQAQADAWGSFRTIAGAITALPDVLRHIPTIQLPVGDWTLGSDGMGELTRFRATYDFTLNVVGAKNCITIAGDDSWSQVSGTPASMAVQSYSNGIVTLQSDPGLSADAFIGNYLLILSGAGVGQFKPLRYHSGTSMTIAGGFSPAASGTSVVRIVKRATTLDIGLVWWEQYGPLDFNKINVETVNGWIEVMNARLRLTGGTRFVGITVRLQSSAIELMNCILDSRNILGAGAAVIVIASSFRTVHGGSRPALIITDGLDAGLWLSGSESGVFKHANYLEMHSATTFQGMARAYIIMSDVHCVCRIGPAVPYYPASDQAAASAVEMEKGASLTVKNVNGYTSSTFKGATQDVLLDGIGVTWEDIEADTDEVVIGPQNSIVRGET